MPRIPEQIERAGPRGVRGGVAIPVDNTGENVASVFSLMGEGLNALQEQMDDFDIAAAEADLLKSHVTTINALQDDDYGTYIERYEKSMNEAGTNAAATIRTPLARRKFQQVAEVARIRGIEQARERARLKEGDLGRATLDRVIASNRESALMAGSETERVFAIKNTQRVINGARARGYIDADRAAVLSRQAAEEYAAASISRMSPEDRIAFLEKNEANSSASFVPADKRDQLIEQAKAEIVARDEAVERKLKQMREDAMKQAYDLIETSGIAAVIGTPLWRDMTGPERSAARKYADNWAKGVEVTAEASRSVYDQMMAIATSPDPKEREKFLTHDLTPLRKDMRLSDYGKLTDFQRTQRLAAYKEAENVAEAKAEAEAKAKKYRTNKEIQDQFLREMGLQPTTTDEEQAKRVGRFRARVEDAIAEKEAAEERVLDSVEVRQITESIAKSYVLEDPWWRSPITKPRFEITIEDIPVDDLALIRSKMRSGAPDDVVVEYYIDNYLQAEE